MRLWCRDHADLYDRMRSELETEQANRSIGRSHSRAYCKTPGCPNRSKQHSVFCHTCDEVLD